MQFNRYIKSLVLALTFSSYTFGQSIAFTFDDGPKVENDSRIKPSERNTLLLQQLKEYGIKSALFISLRDTHDDGLALARKWGEDGHMIGNQTVNHTSLSSKKATLQSFKQELLGCDSIM